jgi:hypothetical protein
MAVVLIALAGLAVVSISRAAPARAGGCTPIHCGTINNVGNASQGYSYVTTLRNWCADESIKTHVGTPFCNTYGNYVQINPGHSTPGGEDYDGFEIAAGCVGYATFYTYNVLTDILEGVRSYPIDRTIPARPGDPGTWSAFFMKVQTNEDVNVSQIC